MFTKKRSQDAGNVFLATTIDVFDLLEDELWRLYSIHGRVEAPEDISSKGARVEIFLGQVYDLSFLKLSLPTRMQQNDLGSSSVAILRCLDNHTHLC